MSSTGTSKRTLILLILAFALPVLAAYSALQWGWYQGGATNRGELLQQLSYDQLQLANPDSEHWQIVTQLPAECDQRCQATITVIQQAHIALGREKVRVQPVIFTTATSDPRAQENLRQLNFTLIPANSEAHQALAPYALVVVDPWGQWVMGYRADPQQAVPLSMGKDLLADLRKLLKLSRIG
ncbi:hypothetical protein [Ferrimonas pelagia]|uniref:Cytochrome oxidase Cu insertion factor, SCO1/SenC/PrrC family n=1 Tax=Ferrimonas pelagia TaxID=1177826 RepID=A0ABP9F5H2_9GAMM